MSTNFIDGTKDYLGVKFTNRLAKDFTATVDKYPNKNFKDKPCKWCGETFKPVGPSHHYCTDTCRKQVYSDKHYKRSYGTTLMEVKNLYKDQDGICAICKTYGFKMREDHTTGMNLDHCHETGKVRGLLCHNCNRGLGLFKDNIEYLLSAISYLETSREPRRDEEPT